jgi:hypothetical protein
MYEASRQPAAWRLALVCAVCPELRQQFHTDLLLGQTGALRKQQCRRLLEILVGQPGAQMQRQAGVVPTPGAPSGALDRLWPAVLEQQPVELEIGMCT